MHENVRDDDGGRQKLTSVSETTDQPTKESTSLKTTSLSSKEGASYTVASSYRSAGETGEKESKKDVREDDGGKRKSASVSETTAQHTKNQLHQNNFIIIIGAPLI